LFILIFVALLSLVGLFFFFSPPNDTVINFLPQESLVYLHLSFDSFHFASRQASRFFYQNWPTQTINFLLDQDPSWQVLKYNFSKDFIAYLQEFGLVFYQKDKQKFPLFIYRLKPAFSNLALVLAGPNNSTVYSYWLSPNLVILSPEKIDNLNFPHHSVFTKSKKPALFSQIFAQIYFDWSKIGLSDKGFFVEDLSKTSYFNLSLKKGGIFFKAQPSKDSGQILMNKIQGFTKRIFVPISSEYLLFYNQETLSDDNLQELTKNLILPNFFKKLYPQVLIFSQDGFIFFAKKPNNLSLEGLEVILKSELSYLLPKEITSILPDGSKVIEFFADPNVFQFEWQNFGQLKLAKISWLNGTANFGLAEDEDFLFFSQDFKFLEKFLQEGQGEDGFLPVKNCWQKRTTQALIYYSQSKGLNLLINKTTSRPAYFLINGCFYLK
jgi:hypothetical protein